MISPPQLLDRVTEAVSYIRISARGDADPALDWLPCGGLVSDPAELLAVVRSTAAGRGTDRDDIALSLFTQAYSFRVASAAIGSWLLSDGEHVFDVRPANTALALGRHRPNVLAFNHVKYRSDPVQSLLFDQHLSLLVASGHVAGDRRIGEALLWGNVAAGCASAFGAFHGAARPDESDDRSSIRRRLVREKAVEFFDGCPAEVKAAGRFVTHVGEAPEPGWFWERTSCCLLYQVEAAGTDTSPVKCEDCSLWSEDERLARYRAVTAADAGSG